MTYRRVSLGGGHEVLYVKRRRPLGSIAKRLGHTLQYTVNFENVDSISAQNHPRLRSFSADFSTMAMTLPSKSAEKYLGDGNFELESEFVNTA